MPTALKAPSSSASSRGRASGGPVEAMVPEPAARDYASMDINEVWKLYAENPTEEIRNFLWERYLPIVRYNAERIHARLPDEVDVEDLVQAGMFGLMGAISAFRLDKNVKFETYCARRVQGAILDELRAMDWVPRLVRSRSTKVENIRRAIETETGQPATDEQIAARLGVGQEEFEKIRRDSQPVSTMSITRKSTEGHNGETRDLEVMRDNGENPIRAMQRKDLREMITKGLSRAERLIVILYYYENMTMKEIGATLALSESRVSQMHSAILERLKAQMQHRTRELEPID
ncbi:MAG: RNA polymerase sigma factor [Phycisphaerales bacterium]|nr:MAG: RNA polymerase sigma factor [Phycisphaerales bacterium]